MIPFVGSGLSRAAGLPDGAALAQWLRGLDLAEGIDFVDLSEERRSSCLAVADRIVRERPDAERALRQRIVAYIRSDEHQVALTPPLRALIHTPTGLVLTLNYDRLLEDAAADQGVPFEPFTQCDLHTVRDRLDAKDRPLFIVHLHGSVDDDESIVLTSNPYRTAAQNPEVEYLLARLLPRFSFCMLGLSFDELYLRAALERIGTSARHVLITDERGRRHVTGGFAALSEEREGILVEAIPEGEWELLDEFCEALVAEPPAPPSEPSVGPAELPPDAGYVSTYLVRTAEERDDLPLSLRLAWRQVSVLRESHVALSDRTVIRGAPGSGKTSLLRRVGELAPPEETPVLISLPRVPEPVGEPLALLVAWAAAGEGLRGAAPVSADALRTRRFHFLFDGLDELPADRQRSFADAVLALAVAEPLHRYTVAARPVAALDAFPEDRWQHLSLHPGHEWREAFLRQRGIAWKDLLLQAPALAHLSELTTLPFFLRQVVELYDADALPQLASLYELAQTLIARHLEAEASLRAITGHVHPWLRGLAFTMQLSGRAWATEAELSTLPTAAPGAVGRPDELTRLLVDRALLRQAGGRVQFVHRLLGEALVAEELLRLGPGTDGLLDVVAPIVAGEHAVRTAWEVPLTMALERSSEWREAVRSRDPLAVARAVPSEADRDERQWAAELIRDRYALWKVWIHDWDSPRLRQDGEVLGDLLGVGDIPDVLSRVVTDLEDPSRQVRSNAIEVLGHAQWGPLEGRLRRVLNSDDDFVVRRQAATQALRARWPSLYEPIKRRALDPEEETERQDMRAAALELAPQEELLALALELARSRDRYWTVSGRLREKLGLSERLAYLRAAAEGDRHAVSTLKEDVIDIAEEAGDGRGLSTKALQDLGFLAAVWELSDPAVLGLVMRHRAQVAGGVLDAIERDRVYQFEVAPLLRLFSPEDLENAGASPELVATRRAWDMPPPEPTTRPRTRAPRRARPTQEPRLAELLDRRARDSDFILLHNCRHYATQVGELDDSHRRKLRQRLGRWWRSGQFLAAFTARNGGFSVEHWALAWTSYGPPLRASVRPEQWAELVRSPWIFDEQRDWLRERYSATAGRLVAAQCDDAGIEVWGNIVHCIPRRLPDDLVAAVIAHARVPDEPHAVTVVADRFASEDRLDELRMLARGAPRLRDGIRPSLAEAGDLTALRTLLRRLAADLAAGWQPGPYGLPWLAGVHDARLLPLLRDCLVAAMRRRTPGTHPDVATPLHAAIRRVGGPAAVALYDDLLSEEPPPFEGVAFVKLQRDVIAQDMLSEAGASADEAFAAAHGYAAWL